MAVEGFRHPGTLTRRRSREVSSSDEDSECIRVQLRRLLERRATTAALTAVRSIEEWGYGYAESRK